MNGVSWKGNIYIKVYFIISDLYISSFDSLYVLNSNVFAKIV